MSGFRHAAMQITEQATVRPLPLLIADAIPFPPLAIGVGATLLLAAGNAICARLSPEGPLVELESAALVAFFCLVVGYHLAAVPLIARATERDFKRLEPALRTSREDSRRLAASLFLQRPLSLAAVSAVALAAALLLNQVARQRLTRFLEPAGWSHFDVSILITIALMWIVVAQSVHLLVNQSRLFRSIGANSVRVDLFDFRPLRPFARVGLRAALFLLIFFALRLVVLPFEDRPYGSEMLTLFAVISFFSFAIVLGALLLPIGGIHRGIQDAKEAELNRISEALGGDQHALQASPIAIARSLRGTELLGYRERVASVSEPR